MSFDEGVKLVAQLMAIAAITAPKAKGVGNVVVKIVDDRETIEALAKKMEELAPELGEFFARDADSIRKSSAVVIVGCKIASFGMKKPRKWSVDVDVAMSLLNLGIALGSAAKVASELNVDNRIMFSAGVAAQELGLIDADVAIAIPLSVSPKNVFFDRKWPKT